MSDGLATLKKLVLGLEDRVRRRRAAVGQLRTGGGGSTETIDTSRGLVRLKDYNERTAALETENKRLRRLLRMAIGKAHPSPHGVETAAKRPWGRDGLALLDETAGEPEAGHADVGSLLFAMRAADDLCVRKVGSHQRRRRRSGHRRGGPAPTTARSNAPADVSALKSRIQELRGRRNHEGRQVKETIASNEKLLAAIHAKRRSLKAHDHDAQAASERTARFNLRRELQLLKRRELLALHTLKSIESEHAQTHKVGTGSPLLALFADDAIAEQPVREEGGPENPAEGEGGQETEEETQAEAATEETSDQAMARLIHDAYNRLEEVEGGMEEADVVGGPDLGEEPIADFCIVYALIQVTGSRWSEIEDGTWTSFFEAAARQSLRVDDDLDTIARDAALAEDRVESLRQQGTNQGRTRARGGRGKGERGGASLGRAAAGGSSADSEDGSSDMDDESGSEGESRGLGTEAAGEAGGGSPGMPSRDGGGEKHWASRPQIPSAPSALAQGHDAEGPGAQGRLAQLWTQLSEAWNAVHSLRSWLAQSSDEWLVGEAEVRGWTYTSWNEAGQARRFVDDAMAQLVRSEQVIAASPVQLAIDSLTYNSVYSRVQGVTASASSHKGQLQAFVVATRAAVSARYRRSLTEEEGALSAFLRLVRQTDSPGEGNAHSGAAVAGRGFGRPRGEGEAARRAFRTALQARVESEGAMVEQMRLEWCMAELRLRRCALQRVAAGEAVDLLNAHKRSAEEARGEHEAMSKEVETLSAADSVSSLPAHLARAMGHSSTGAASPSPNLPSPQNESPAESAAEQLLRATESRRSRKVERRRTAQGRGEQDGGGDSGKRPPSERHGFTPWETASSASEDESEDEDDVRLREAVVAKALKVTLKQRVDLLRRLESKLVTRTREFNAVSASESRVSTRIATVRRQNLRLESQLALLRQKSEAGVPHSVAEMHQRRMEREQQTVRDISQRTERAEARRADEELFVLELQKPPDERCQLGDLALELRKKAAKRHQENKRHSKGGAKPSGEEERLMETVQRLEKQRQWWESRVSEALELMEA